MTSYNIIYNPPDNKTYPIKTLQDIFDLPTRDHMERCLKDVGDAILYSRDFLDNAKRRAEQEGIVIKNNPYFDFKLKDPIDWIDDGQHEIRSEFRFNNEVIARAIKHSP